MIVEQTCRKCGASISSRLLGGLCGKCLGRLGFLSSPAEDTTDSSGGAPKPHRFGQYELLEEIGRGGMGVVYKARQLGLGRVVAVKMILHGPFSSEQFVQRFHLEAQAAAALHHPNIVAIYEVGQQDGQHYFSMEYLEGQSLGELAQEKPVSPKQAADYLKTIAQAMHYAHEQGVLHRDLKPSNVLIDMWNEPRILDFGLAKLLETDTQLTISGQTLGSPNYMAPEQAGGKPDGAGSQADIYSLGAILYYLLTGVPPFRGETLQEVLTQLQSAEPVAPHRLNPGVPVDLQTICLKCLHKEPARRYATAWALAEDLARFLANEPILARPTSTAQKGLLWCRRHPIPALLSSLLIAALLLGLAGILWQWRRAELFARGETQQRQLAEASANETRKHLYAADIALASQALQRGEYGLARRTLAALRPKSGQQDWRGFEWRYLYAQCQGDELATLAGHTWIVTCTAFSPDGRLLASGSQDGTTKIWDATRHTLLATLPATAGAVWSTAFSPDGALLMSAGNLAGVKFWNTTTWEIVAQLPGQIATLSKTAPLAAISESNPLYWESTGKVSLWNYRTGEKLREFSEPGRALALSADDSLVAAAGPTSGVYLWDARSGRLLRTLPTASSVWSLAFSPKGDRLVTAGWSAEPLVWDLRAKDEPTRLKGHLRNVWAATFSPDGSSIRTVSSDQTIRSWDAATFAPKTILRGHENEVWCVAYSPDGKTLATGGKDQTVRLWPAEPASVPNELPNLGGNRPFFSRDGKRLVALNGKDEQARSELWDVPGRAQLSECPQSPEVGFSADGASLVHLDSTAAALERFSPEGRNAGRVKLQGITPGPESFACSGFSPTWDWFFAVDSAGMIRFWETATGKLAGSISGPKPPIRAAVLSAQGEYLAISLERENSVRLYATAAQKEFRLQGHRDFVSGLAFAPDGATLASGSVDGTILLWNPGTGKQLGSLPGHLQETTDVAFSPDGRTLASLALGDSLKLWHLPTLREVVSINFPEAGHFVQFSADGRYLAVTTTRNSVRLFEAPEE